MAARPASTRASGFDDQFTRARANIFRLETLQNYGNSGEEPALAAFLAGEPHLITPGKRRWTSIVRDRVAAGCAMQRVHVVTEPLTDYVKFELTWGYAPNVAAGEDIRIIPVAQHQPWPADLPCEDFWLFDSTVLFAMHYGTDGTWLGVERVTDPAAIDRACRCRTAALRLAMPWADYIDQRQELAQHVPPGQVARAP